MASSKPWPTSGASWTTGATTTTMSGHTDPSATRRPPNVRAEPPEMPFYSLSNWTCFRGRVRLTRQQQTVAKILEEKQTGKHLLREYYLGALHVLDDSGNPDRVSQAAHSLREILDKLSQINREKNTNITSFIKEERQELDERLSQDKDHYQGVWIGEKISEHLADTIKRFSQYLELNKQPPRRDKIATDIMPDLAISGSDVRTQEKEKEKLKKLWQAFEVITHHKKSETEELRKLLEELEITLSGLFAFEIEQKEIRSILERSDRSKNDEKRIFELIGIRKVNYTFLFRTMDDPGWIPILKKKDYFEQPPLESMVSYLERVSETNPSLAVDTILYFKNINDTICLRIVVDIALKIKPLEQSLRLKDLVLEFLRHPNRPQASNGIASVVEYWARASVESANTALKIMQETIEFDPDPEWKKKQNRRRADPRDLAALALDPKPQLDWWIYDRILEEWVRPLSEIEPVRATRILIDATAKMIGFHHDDDPLTWCNRVNETDEDPKDSRVNLIHALTFSCEKVYEKAPESVLTLNDDLKKQGRCIFARIRQHLYALHPNEQTKPWIREMILSYEGYGKQRYRLEMERMISSACESIGNDLLDEEEKERIFEDILAGPLTAELPEERKRRIHSMQLKPFASVLFGKYADYFEKLEI